MRNLAAAALLLIAFPTPSSAQAVDGQSVKSVSYAGGVFRLAGPKKWVEESTRGGRFSFVEEKRDNTSVVLFDASRNLRLRLDLPLNKVLQAPNGTKSFTALYEITSASAAATAPATASKPGNRQLDAKDQLAADIAYVVAQKSPLLPAASRTAISQDYNGAPLSGKPAVHAVHAETVSCRARSQDQEGTGAACQITFSKGKSVSLAGTEAKTLYVALGKAGVMDDPGAGSIVRKINSVSCTVDDKVAQSTPGNVLLGFACKFSTE